MYTKAGEIDRDPTLINKGQQDVIRPEEEGQHSSASRSVMIERRVERVNVAGEDLYRRRLG